MYEIQCLWLIHSCHSSSYLPNEKILDMRPITFSEHGISRFISKVFKNSFFFKSVSFQFKKKIKLPSTKKNI